MALWTCALSPFTALVPSAEPGRQECEDRSGVSRYLVDNRTLQTSSPGLAYRNSQVLSDKHREELAPWGTEVAGIDTGQGWLQVGKFFLPFRVEDAPVLVYSGRGYATGQCVTCSHFGRNPFFCFFGKVKEGACVTVNAEFDSINRDRNTLKPGMRGVVLEVDADDDRRIQFEGFDKAQWVAFHKLLFLTITKEGQAGEVREGRPALPAPDGEAVGVEGDPGGARYTSYMAWLFGQAAPKEARCPENHPCAVAISEDSRCINCAATGTHFQCSQSCSWSICYQCFKSIPGYKPGLAGRWIKGELPSEEIETIEGDKITFARGECHDLRLTSDTSCELLLDGNDFSAELSTDGMKLAWSDGDTWTRSLRNEYVQMRQKLDVHAALDALRVPKCGECGSATRWTSTPENQRWTCANYTKKSCGNKGCNNRFPWRWHCQECSYNLCTLCGPQIPITLDTLRPQTVPITEEWLTAGSKSLMSDAGRYYHEVLLGAGLNSPHVGWLTQHFTEKDFDGHGVGTNAHGWAADGVRHKKWHCGCVDAAWPREWEPGDVIGCAIDIEAGRMSFSLNGQWVADAEMFFESMQRFFFPAVSMNGDFDFNISKESWRFSPPWDGYQAWAHGGKYARPRSADLREGDRVCVQESCMSNSRDPTRLQKGQLGTVRTIDEDGDALIDFDEHGKGEWIFRTCFERLRILDLMRTLVDTDMPVVATSDDTKAPAPACPTDAATTEGDKAPSPSEAEAASSSGEARMTEGSTSVPEAQKERLAQRTARSALSEGLVGIWDFAGGTFDVEDQNGKLFFYGSELKPEEGSGWMLTKLPKTGVSYRLRLNRPRGNVLVWQEMGKGGDAWEATHYATRRGRMSDGAQIVTTMQASIWGSAHSGHELGLAPGGAALVLAGPRVQGDGLWMAPVRPRGAVELRCIRLDEPLDEAIEAVDTNSLSGPEGQKYDCLDSIWEALEDGDTQLIKGTWLKTLADKDGVLPRRREVPPEAAWEPLELQELVERRRVQIVAVSYCWLTSEHPDPKGCQLKTIANVIDQRLDEVTIPLDDLAVFIDWCSLYQMPRDDDEEDAYKRGFKSVNLWYAHAQTMVWLLTVVPEGVLQFAVRGWPTFERAVSVMLTESSKLLDLGKLNDTCTRWFQTCKICTMQRQPPLVPDVFDATLKSKIFALETDRPAVELKYAQTFHEVMASAKFLEFQALGWDPQQVACFAEALPYCRSLTKLTLTENEVGTARKALCEGTGEPTEDSTGEVATPVAAKALAIHLPKVNRLRQILCRGCNIGDEDMVILALALPRCMALVTLNLQDNKIGAKGTVALAKVLPDCERLGLLYLASNKVGEEGALALAKFAPNCDTLRELWVTDAGDMGAGKQVLIDTWRDKGKAEGFLHL